MNNVHRFVGIAAVALLAVVAGCGGSSPSASGRVSTASPPPPPRAQAGDDRYVLSFELPKATWRVSEPITGAATLRLISPSAMTVWGSGTGLVGFGFDQLGGDKSTDWLLTADCVPRELSASTPLVIALYKTWSYAADATPDPQIHLSVGDWKIAAMADFTDDLCAGVRHNLEAALMIHVVP
jgi:hypothetical protein